MMLMKTVVVQWALMGRLTRLWTTRQTPWKARPVMMDMGRREQQQRDGSQCKQVESLHPTSAGWAHLVISCTRQFFCSPDIIPCGPCEEGFVTVEVVNENPAKRTEMTLCRTEENLQQNVQL